ncbi:hypothetical protein [Nocardia sp. NPDC059239]|uniref:hypothetical protein n=1 Tax=unclassified Nocardia TaxID=2637762 RepID=UPI0036CB9DCA
MALVASADWARLANPVVAVRLPGLRALAQADHRSSLVPIATIHIADGKVVNIREQYES